MPFPNFEGKHALDSLVTPRDLIAFLRRRGAFPDFVPPASVVICYQPSLLRHIVETEEVQPLKIMAGDFYLLLRTGRHVGVVGGFGIGAPVAATVVEELIAHGTTAFINIGTAGGLQKDRRIGDLVVCSQAVRDEGVSHHYLPPAKSVAPDLALTALLKAALARAGLPYAEGPTWTIDTPYRETVEEARHYQREGVQTVEMEAAAVFAVAQVRRAAAAAAFTISDSLADLVWDPQFGAREVDTGLAHLYRAAVGALMVANPGSEDG